MGEQAKQVCCCCHRCWEVANKPTDILASKLATLCRIFSAVVDVVAASVFDLKIQPSSLEPRINTQSFFFLRFVWVCERIRTTVWKAFICIFIYYFLYILFILAYVWTFEPAVCVLGKQPNWHACGCVWVCAWCTVQYTLIKNTFSSFFAPSFIARSLKSFSLSRSSSADADADASLLPDR